MLRQLCAHRHRLTLACVLRLHKIAQSVLYVIACFLLAELVNRLLDFFHRLVRRMVINNNDLQLIKRIILIKTADNRAPNPGFLIKTGNDNRHARRKLRINRHRLIKRRKQITRQQENRCHNTIKIEPLVKLEIQHALRAHHDNYEDDEKHKEAHGRKSVAVTCTRNVLHQSFVKLYATARLALCISKETHALRINLDLRLIALRHRSR